MPSTEWDEEALERDEFIRRRTRDSDDSSTPDPTDPSDPGTGRTGARSEWDTEGTYQHDFLGDLYYQIRGGLKDSDVDTSDIDREIRLATQNLGRRQVGVEEDALSGLVGVGLGDQPHLLARARQNVRLQGARAAGDIELRGGIERSKLRRQQMQQRLSNALQLYGIEKGVPVQQSDQFGWDDALKLGIGAIPILGPYIKELFD